MFFIIGGKMQSLEITIEQLYEELKANPNAHFELRFDGSFEIPMCMSFTAQDQIMISTVTPNMIFLKNSNGYIAIFLIRLIKKVFVNSNKSSYKITCDNRNGGNPIEYLLLEL